LIAELSKAEHKPALYYLAPFVTELLSAWNLLQEQSPTAFW